jgi:hypothetical protein
MSKTILSLVAAALVCAAGSTVLANDGLIASTTLSSMGLGSLEVMSDAEGLAVRGLGYSGGHNSYGGHKNKHDSKKPWASAEGKSWAVAGIDGYHEEAAAGSHNEYAAEGKYHASGNNFSEATASKTESLRVDFPDGTFSMETKVRSISVGAGGFSSANAF